MATDTSISSTSTIGDTTTDNAASTGMNYISGRIVLRENNIGIPNLLVVVYDLDPGTLSEDSVSSDSMAMASTGDIEIDGDRIGSVLTDAQGGFRLSYADSEFQIRNSEKRPDLYLLVLAPEENTLNRSARTLYASQTLRQNAGRTEHYFIRLNASQLTTTGIPLPTTSSSSISGAEVVVSETSDILQRAIDIEDGVRQSTTTAIDNARSRRVTIESRMEPFIDILSSVSSARRAQIDYVNPGESVESANFQVLGDQIDSKINKAPTSRGQISLTEEQIDTLRDSTGQIKPVISAAEIEYLHYGVAKGAERKTELLRENPVALKKRAKEIPDALLPAPPMSEELPPDAGTPDILPTDVTSYVAELMQNMRSPEEMIAYGVGKRADDQDIKRDVEAFELHGGPADVPSYHDFHHLQIAFEHIWQEALDEEIIQTATDAYEQIVDMGGNPESRLLLGQNPFKVLTQEAKYIASVESRLERRGQYVYGGSVPPPRRPGSNGLPPPRTPGEVRDHRGESRPPTTPGQNLVTILSELEQRAREAYPFTLYAANRRERSINFGLLTTYRQRWEPVTYQVGELAKTLTLAPKETRKFSKKQIVRSKRVTTQTQTRMNRSGRDSSDISRAESEIIDRAESKSAFNLTAEASYGIGGFKGNATTSFGRDSSASSQEVKKNFREAVLKATQEYKNEHKIEVSTEDSFESEYVESGEITNPNDEIPVTYLFYELQRRYRISEKIHRVRPVVFVAQEMPRPNEIDEEWLISNDWILQRVLLDSSFSPALTYLSARYMGDLKTIEELHNNVERQRRIADQLKNELRVTERKVGNRYQALEYAINMRAGVVGGNDDEGLLGKAKDWFAGSSGESEDAARMREDAARDAYERVLREEKEQRARLQGEVNALNEATAAYTAVLSEHMNYKTQILRLRVHVKQNILYYMQAIWDHEPPDQRLFRLHKVKVPKLNGSNTYSLKEIAPEEILAKTGQPHPREGTTPFEINAQLTLNSKMDPSLDYVTLAEIADIDNMLGYKGNYMIFPMNQSNALTDYMMAPYVDNFFELSDPDRMGNWTLEEFSEYVLHLRATLPEIEFDAMQPQLREQYVNLLTSPRRNSEEIVIPSGALYIEALPGKHPVMEDFKLVHRAIDVKKAQSEVREAELENVRAAARLLVSDYEDPDIESLKKVIFDGSLADTTVNV